MCNGCGCSLSWDVVASPSSANDGELEKSFVQEAIRHYVIEWRGWWPMGCGPNLAGHLFWMICKLRMVFTFLNDSGGKSHKKNNIPWHMKIIWKSNFNIYKSFYWSTVMLICLHICWHITCGCFHNTMAELSNCHKEWSVWFSNPKYLPFGISCTEFANA